MYWWSQSLLYDSIYHIQGITLIEYLCVLAVLAQVLEALDELKKKTEAQAEEILPIEKLIAEAYSVIDKAVKVGTLHRNTGARRKSRLARRKKAVEIHHGWYVPAAATVVSASA